MNRHNFFLLDQKNTLFSGNVDDEINPDLGDCEFF